MSQLAERIDLFTTKAELVSAQVSRVASMEEALGKAVSICRDKEACQLLASGCEESLSPAAEAACDSKVRKTIAAPALDEAHGALLAGLCADQDFDLLTSGMRQHLGGIDVAVTMIDWGVAETGTLVLDSASEEVRLATMISEVHVAILPLSRLRDDSLELADWLTERMAAGPDYTAFITGPSRTADIERVLALGVHGPLELHILLLEDENADRA